MLPDFRALVVAVVAAVVLLTLSFGVVAAFRVAQEDRAGFMHAEFAQRTRQTLPQIPAPHAILIVDTSPMTVAATPEAEIPAPVAAAAIVSESSAEPDQKPAANSSDANPQVATAVSAPIPEMPAILEQEIAAAPPPAPPMGGPFAEVTPPDPQQAARLHAQALARAAKAAKIAAERKQRAAKLARERKLAARRAAARRAQTQASTTSSFGWNTPQTSSFDSFNSGFSATTGSTKTR